MVPATGVRFTCTSNTFMNTATQGSGLAPISSSGGGTRGEVATTTPSAGLTTSEGSSGVTRGGSRKKNTHQAVAKRPTQNSGTHRKPRITATAKKIAMNGHPSRWIGGRTERIGPYWLIGTGASFSAAPVDGAA